MPLTTSIKNTLLDSLPSITHVSAHSGFPGDTGANEISGGSYARAAIAFAAASNGQRLATSSPVISVQNGKTITYLGFWSSGTFVGSVAVATAVFGGDGTYTVSNAKLSLG